MASSAMSIATAANRNSPFKYPERQVDGQFSLVCHRVAMSRGAGKFRAFAMSASADAPAPEGLEIRTYFVRGRNALVARADFGELFVDYYLHQGQHGYQHIPAHDGLLKEALAALALHCASRPWNEAVAWTIHFQQPLLNLFL